MYIQHGQSRMRDADAALLHAIGGTSAIYGVPIPGQIGRERERARRIQKTPVPDDLGGDNVKPQYKVSRSQYQKSRLVFTTLENTQLCGLSK